jgi:hypothetical protein
MSNEVDYDQDGELALIFFPGLWIRIQWRRMDPNPEGEENEEEKMWPFLVNFFSFLILK